MAKRMTRSAEAVAAVATQTEEVKEKSRGMFIRSITESITVRKQDNGGQTILEFPASSEYPVERWYGTEILSHDKSAVDLTRAKGGAMPLLFNHERGDIIGMIQDAWIESKRVMVRAVLFGTDRAIEVQKMIEGGLRNVSLGYEVRTVEEEIKSGTFTATEWAPYEISIVTVPADPTVGIDRGGVAPEFRMLRAAKPIHQPAAEHAAITRGEGMEDKAKAAAPVAASAQPAMSVSQETGNAKEIEAARIRAIKNLCSINKIDAKLEDFWVRSGLSIDKVTDDMLLVMEERGKHNPQSVAALGLSPREAQQFSLVRAINACVDNQWDKAGFELECSREIAKRLQRAPDQRRFFVPLEAQNVAHEVPEWARRGLYGQRDATVASGAGGGFLVQTSNMGFVELLRNQAVVMAMGAQRLTGLRDSITIPKQTVAATTTWLANEAATITETNLTFAQISLTPKSIGGYVEISRQLLLQSSPSIEGIVNTDLARVVALDIDLKALNGSGASGQPTGIIATAGIGGVTGTSIAYAGIVEFQTDVFGGNTLTPNCGYVTTGAVAGLLKQRVKFTSTASPIWEGQLQSGQVDGYRAMASNQMPSANLLFGDFGTVVIGEWGVLEIETNPFANFQAGIVGVRAIASIDVAVRYPGAFSLATAVT